MNKKLIPVVGILLILGVGGFIFLQQKSSPPVSPEIKKAQQEMIANCKYDADFCKYAANGIVAMSGGYTMTSESIYNGKKSKMVMRADGKENMESTTYTDGKEEGSFISINKTTYMRGPGEKVWTEFPPTKDEAGKPTTNLFDFEGLKKELGNATKDVADSLVVKKVGTEPCGKLTCSVFEMTEKAFNTTTKVWVDTKEYLARKMESTTKEGISTMTFEYGPVVITTPAPVKKMPAFDSTLKDAGVNINSEEIQNLMKNIPPANSEGTAPVETPAE
jgi:outer membrane lipoprotein-sorting protein